MDRGIAFLFALFAACDSPAQGVDASMDGGMDAMAPPLVPGLVAEVQEPDLGVLAPALVDACAECEAASACEVALCLDGACVIEAAPDTTLCGEDGHHCVRGVCRLRGCGDGYREPGPEPLREACDDGNSAAGDACDGCMPTVATLATRDGGHDSLLGPGAIGVDGQGHGLIVWASEQDAMDEPSLQLLAQRVSRGGASVGEPVVLASDFPLGAQLSPMAAGLAEGWAVVWLEQGQAFVRRVLSDGAVSAERIVGDDLQDVALAGSGFDTLVFAASAESLVLHRFDEEFQPERPDTLVRADIRQVAAASSPVGWAIAYAQADVGMAPWDVVVRARLSGDVRTYEVSEGPGAEPAIAAITGGYALAWTTPQPDPRGDIRTRALSGDGVLGMSAVVADRPAYVESIPSVASLGEGWFVGWHERSEQGGAGLVAIWAESPESAPLQQRLAPPGDHGGLALASGADFDAWIAWSVGAPFGAAGAIRSSFFTILSEGSR